SRTRSRLQWSRRLNATERGAHRPEIALAAELASMEPSPERDGEFPEPHCHRSAAVRLQWSRRLNATESPGGPGPVRLAPHASMEPSPERDGEKPGRRCERWRTRRFNGGAARTRRRAGE